MTLILVDAYYALISLKSLGDIASAAIIRYSESLSNEEAKSTTSNLAVVCGTGCAFGHCVLDKA